MCVWALLLALSIGSSFLIVEGEPWAHEDTRRIVDGNAVVVALPWMVSLRVNTDGQWQHICGGTLVAPGWVLTAAHCSAANVEPLQAWVGGLHLTAATEYDAYDVKERHCHPNFDPKSLAHDICLFRVAPAAPTRTAAGCVRPTQAITVAGVADPLPRTVEVAGWGAVQSGDTAPANQLNSATLPVTSNNDCQAVFRARATNHVFCAGFSESAQDACVGDSGGPAYHIDVRGAVVQYGVVSGGIGCAQPFRYGLYTKLSTYREWLETTVSASGEALHNGSDSNPETADSTRPAGDHVAQFTAEALTGAQVVGVSPVLYLGFLCSPTSCSGDLKSYSALYQSLAAPVVCAGRNAATLPTTGFPTQNATVTVSLSAGKGLKNTSTTVAVGQGGRILCRPTPDFCPEVIIQGADPMCEDWKGTANMVTVCRVDLAELFPGADLADVAPKHITVSAASNGRPLERVTGSGRMAASSVLGTWTAVDDTYCSLVTAPDRAERLLPTMRTVILRRAELVVASFNAVTGQIRGTYENFDGQDFIENGHFYCAVENSAGSQVKYNCVFVEQPLAARAGYSIRASLTASTDLPKSIRLARTGQSGDVGPTYLVQSTVYESSAPEGITVAL